MEDQPIRPDAFMVLRRAHGMVLSVGAVVCVFAVSFYVGVHRATPTGLKENLFVETSTHTLLSESQIMGQNLIVGIQGAVVDVDTVTFLKQIMPGGVVLYARNYESREQLRKLIADLQAIARETTNHPYFIMIDEEPGGVTRLNLFQGVLYSGYPNYAQIAQDLSVLEDLGINVDLAPISDFAFNADTFIKRRMPVNTPEALIEFNATLISMLHDANILSTMKHFPGMGIFETDPHRKLPRSDISGDAYEMSMKIFGDGIQNGTDFVMTAHGVYEDIDPLHSATMSSKIIDGILRKQLHFQGLVITDDLSDMPFVLDKKIDLTTASVEALKSGQNMLMFAHDATNTRHVVESIQAQMLTDPSLHKIIENNYEKVIALKKRTIELHNEQ